MRDFCEKGAGINAESEPPSRPSIFIIGIVLLLLVCPNNNINIPLFSI